MTKIFCNHTLSSPIREDCGQCMRKERDAYKEARDRWYEDCIDILQRKNKLEDILGLAIALSDTGSGEFKERFDPYGSGEIPAGWKVVEAMREVLLRAC